MPEMTRHRRKTGCDSGLRPPSLLRGRWLASPSSRRHLVFTPVACLSSVPLRVPSSAHRGDLLTEHRLDPLFVRADTLASCSLARYPRHAPVDPHVHPPQPPFPTHHTRGIHHDPALTLLSLDLCPGYVPHSPILLWPSRRRRLITAHRTTTTPPPYPFPTIPFPTSLGR
ncbi:hypothetical protein DENSPDRAFT_112274 [Dentipellis sp. KUC8613]|nr:hypothetical protein DENSPDRAFT_112274 [Dentipellis sp. KUC8613]